MNQRRSIFFINIGKYLACYKLKKNYVRYDIQIPEGYVLK